MADIRLFAALLTAFIIASGFMAFVISEKELEKINQFSIMESLDVQYFNSQNFTSNSTFVNNNVRGNVSYSGVWTQSNIGYTLTTTSYGDRPTLVFKNVQKTNGKYDITYYINNSVHQPFSIWLKFTASYIMFQDNEEIVIDADGIKMREYIHDLVIPYPFGYDVYTYANPQVMLQDNLKIRTVFSPNDKTVEVYYNDVRIMNVDNLAMNSGIIQLASYYYCGVSSRTEGFTLMGFDAPVTDIALSSENSGIDNVMTFVKTFFDLLTWRIPEKYLPFFFQVIFIGIPELALTFIGLIAIRSG